MRMQSTVRITDHTPWRVSIHYKSGCVCCWVVNLIQRTAVVLYPWVFWVFT